MKNHYDTLEVETFAPFETISKSYKRLILLYHPDKQQQSNDTFIKIQEAWEILRDDESRKKYDKDLEQEQASSTVAVSEEVSLDDMQLSESGEEAEYSWPCRCGDKFVVSDAELDEGADLVFCRSCSFAIKIVY
eukprot:Phypoly_transcript_25388.p1 GENE.Phypoly_transcript_25388~~Phypoly_transcript_25388.p1  ORF type:complete len:134 (+),score=24.10 Phypoly_transcript_25388:103-504(+)